MERSYKKAISILLSRRRGVRPQSNAVPRVSEATTITPGLKGAPSLDGMEHWLSRLGHSSEDLNCMNVIHVAGTKGKGSTCAFTESLLRAHGMRTGFPQKTGLYTSPHLLRPEERIRINFQPISRTLFAEMFFEVYEGLDLTEDNPGPPRTLQLCALTAFHTFIKLRVDVAIVETHHGGEYDLTNVIPKPVATAITALGMDHVRQLGPTIENIAWHKAGIFKPGASAFSTLQDESPAAVLRRRASEKGVTLNFVDVEPDLPDSEPQLQVGVQKANCSLAVSVVKCFLESKAPQEQLKQEDILHGIRQYRWPGRFELLVEGKNKWFLDVAHNELSIKIAAGWFADTSESAPAIKRILIFSQASDERDGESVVESLASFMMDRDIQMHHVIFTSTETVNGSVPVFTGSTASLSPDYRQKYTRTWKTFFPDADIVDEPNADAALKLAKTIGQLGDGMDVLVTGSQHLVSYALSVLRPAVKEDSSD